MSNFPKLVPAFKALIPISAPSSIGSTRAGGLDHVSFVPESGSFKSEPGYPVQVDAVFAHGSDYIRRDPDGRHLRLEVSSLARDKSSGAYLRYNYTGTIRMDGAAAKVLSGSPGAKTTDFGEIFTHVTFESGNATLKTLEEKVYVGSGRFVVEEGKPLAVEYNISEVTA